MKYNLVITKLQYIKNELDHRNEGRKDVGRGDEGRALVSLAWTWDARDEGRGTIARCTRLDVGRGDELNGDISCFLRQTEHFIYIGFPVGKVGGSWPVAQNLDYTLLLKLQKA